MSQRSKCNVVVISESGKSWTTKRGARRLVDRELAERQPDGSVRMRESDYRFACSSGPHNNGPRLEVSIPPLAFHLCWLNSEAAVLRFAGKAA